MAAGVSAAMPILAVIVGSIRPGRAGQPIAEWFIDRARSHGGFDVDVADLAIADAGTDDSLTPVDEDHPNEVLKMIRMRYYRALSDSLRCTSRSPSDLVPVTRQVRVGMAQASRPN
jgi:hypothetical protein